MRLVVHVTSVLFEKLCFLLEGFFFSSVGVFGSWELLYISLSLVQSYGFYPRHLAGLAASVCRFV